MKSQSNRARKLIAGALLVLMFLAGIAIPFFSSAKSARAWEDTRNSLPYVDGGQGLDNDSPKFSDRIPGENYRDGRSIKANQSGNPGGPMVIDHIPADGAANVPVTSKISVTWNRDMRPDSDFLIAGPSGSISGTFSYDASARTVVFTPTQFLSANSTYTVTVSGQVDASGNEQQVSVKWRFETLSPTSVSISEFGQKPGLRDQWWWQTWPWLMVLLSALSLTGFIWIKLGSFVVPDRRTKKR